MIVGSDGNNEFVLEVLLTLSGLHESPPSSEERVVRDLLADVQAEAFVDLKRTTDPFVAVGHGFFRRYLHGGFFGAFTGDLFRDRRAHDEVRVLAELRSRGAPCPEPLAAYEQEVGLGFRRQAILTRAIPGARAAPEATEHPAFGGMAVRSTWTAVRAIRGTEGHRVPTVPAAMVIANPPA